MSAHKLSNSKNGFWEKMERKEKGAEMRDEYVAARDTRYEMF